MSIFTNSSNPATLKILISANFARKAVDIKIVDSKERALDDPRHLPYLKTNEENSIFVPNSAVSFFVPSQESKTNEWLEWEATVLSPGLAQTLGGNVKHLKDSVTAALKKIEEALNHSLSLTSQELITAADIAVWSSLFPLTVDDNLAKEFLAENLNVSRWIKRLGEIKEFQSAVNLFKIESGVGAYQALLTGAKYLTPTENMSQSPATENVSVEELETAETFWNSSEKIPKLVSRPKIVLPGKGRNILITSALPYVNNVPHLGNIIGCVLSADVFARFCRICNYNTLYIGGTDEYGTATETKALEEGLSCRAICDKYYAIHKDIYDWFNISFDHFGRTSSPEQTEITQDMFQILNKNGFIFVEPVEQLHCEKCDRYLADRFVEGGCPHPGCKYEDARGDQCDGCGKLVNAVDLKNPRCKICRNTPKLKISKQFYIDLPKLEPLLLHWMKKSAPGWSSNAQVIARAWLKEGLKPRCITRDLKWGIPVPVDGFREKVFYVWFDAPFGYMSSTAAYTKDWELWWKPQKGVEVSLYQFMAKDNVPFHSIMFPAALLGTNRGYTTVSHIMATEYLNYEDGKFSKSRGVGVFGNDARDTGIPSDVWRFYLLYVRPESQDSSFSWSDLATKNNSELLNNLGNFVNRALVFAKNNFDHSVPEMEPIRDDFVLLALCARELKGYVASLEKAKLRDGIRHILSISRHGNQYMQTNQPWVLLKGSPEDKVRAGTVIGVCCNIACLLALLLHPYMPETSDNLRKQLNAPVVSLDSSNMAVFKFLAAGHKIGEPAPLFTKLEQTHVEELKQKFAGRDQERNQANAEVPATNGIDVKYLEEEVTKQGLVVRKLKESGTDKAVWQPEVTKLLGLKTKLAAALGSPVEAKKNGKKGKK